MGGPARRTSAEVHRLILGAATELFAERGLAATGMRDIARAAGVAEPLLYRHFGTKENLVREAVFAPLRRFFSDYTARWRASLADGGPPPGSRSYMTGLYDVLRANRRLLLSLLASDVHRDATFTRPGADSPLAGLLSDVEELVALEQARSPRGGPEPGPSVRFTFALCLSMALFGDLMFPADRPRPDHDRLMAEMAAFLSQATSSPPAGGAGPAGGRP